MGDRISIQFRDQERRVSPILFSHYDGKDLLVKVKYYYDELYQYHLKEKMHMPLSRMESGTVMVDFIRWLTKGKERVESDYYLGCSPDDGDNSDNGHHIWDLYEAKWYSFSPIIYKGLP